MVVVLVVVVAVVVGVAVAVAVGISNNRRFRIAALRCVALRRVCVYICLLYTSPSPRD